MTQYFLQAPQRSHWEGAQSAWLHRIASVHFLTAFIGHTELQRTLWHTSARMTLDWTVHCSLAHGQNVNCSNVSFKHWYFVLEPGVAQHRQYIKLAICLPRGWKPELGTIWGVEGVGFRSFWFTEQSAVAASSVTQPFIKNILWPFPLAWIYLLTDSGIMSDVFKKHSQLIQFLQVSWFLS